MGSSWGAGESQHGSAGRRARYSAVLHETEGTACVDSEFAGTDQTGDAVVT